MASQHLVQPVEFNALCDKAAKLPTFPETKNLSNSNILKQYDQAQNEHDLRLYHLAGLQTVEDLIASHAEDAVPLNILLDQLKAIYGNCLKIQGQIYAPEDEKADAAPEEEKQALLNVEAGTEEQAWINLNNFIAAQNKLIKQTLETNSIEIYNKPAILAKQKRILSKKVVGGLLFCIFGSLSVAAFSLTVAAALAPALPYLIGGALCGMIVLAAYSVYKKKSKAAGVMLGIVAAGLIAAMVVASLGLLGLGVIISWPVLAPMIALVAVATLAYLPLAAALTAGPKTWLSLKFSSFSIAKGKAIDLVLNLLIIGALFLAFNPITGIGLTTLVLAAAIVLAVAAVVSVLASFIAAWYAGGKTKKPLSLKNGVKEMVCANRDLILMHQDSDKTVVRTISDDITLTSRSIALNHQMKEGILEKMELNGCEAITRIPTLAVKQLDPQLAPPPASRESLGTLANIKQHGIKKADCTIKLFTASTPASEKQKDVNKSVANMAEIMLSDLKKPGEQKEKDQDQSAKDLREMSALLGDGFKPLMLYNNLLSPMKLDQALTYVIKHADNNTYFVKSAAQAVEKYNSENQLGKKEIIYLNRPVNRLDKTTILGACLVDHRETENRAAEGKIIKHLSDRFKKIAGFINNPKEHQQALLNFANHIAPDGNVPLEEKMPALLTALENGDVHIENNKRKLSKSNQQKLALKVRAVYALKQSQNNKPQESEPSMALHLNALSDICADTAWVGCKSARDRTAFQLAAITVLIKYPERILHPHAKPGSANAQERETFMQLVNTELNTGHALKVGHGCLKASVMGKDQTQHLSDDMKRLIKRREKVSGIFGGKDCDPDAVDRLTPNHKLIKQAAGLEEGSARFDQLARSTETNHFKYLGKCYQVLQPIIS